MNEAIEQVSTMKVDALALHLGYRSKKNFYRAFLFHTPDRRLPHSGSSALRATEAARETCSSERDERRAQQHAIIGL